MVAPNATHPELFTTSSEDGVTPSGVIAVGVVLPVLATIAVLLRLYAIRIKGNRFGLDDLFIAIGLVS